jgi:AraC-like DNA-binding protein
MPIMSITVACGFRSPAHFSKSYRAVFGHSPSRQRLDPAGAAPAAAAPGATAGARSKVKSARPPRPPRPLARH